MTLELHNLKHKGVREYVNIVDVLGLCLEPVPNAVGLPAFSMVLEYSHLRDLAFFL